MCNWSIWRFQTSQKKIINTKTRCFGVLKGARFREAKEKP